MTKIQAICFDVDGTLINTTEYIYGAFEHSLGLHNQEILGRDMMQRMMGKQLEDCYRDFTDLSDVQELMDTHHEYQLENPELAVAYPYAEETLKRLREMGISIAAVTTRVRETAIQTLEFNGLYSLVDFFVGLEDVSSPKPDPEGIKKALDYFGVHPSDAIMVGDSPVDVEAGKNAKTYTIGVTHGFHGDAIAELEPDYVIDGLSEIIEIVEEM